MRLIASCPDCQTQYWSDEIEDRRSLNCYCGNVLQLRSGPPVDAKVVRCSSCGAARESGASACQFCHSDFTIHEKDLNTICPHCMARVSDVARFCHYCGGRIQPQFASGTRSAMLCPACEGSRPLYSRREIGQIPFHECHVCAGVWLDLTSFRNFIENSKSEETLALLGQLPNPKISVTDLSGEAGPQSRFYRPCPACRNIMSRHNVASKSGVIVDLCNSHGVWFDGNELAQLIQWIRHGGLERARRNQTTLKTPAREGIGAGMDLSGYLLKAMADLLKG